MAMVQASSSHRRLIAVAASVVVMGVVAAGAFAVTRTTESCAPGGGDLSVYEWRTSAWDTPAAAADMIAAAEELCLSAVHVDVTGLAVDGIQDDIEASLIHLLSIAEVSSVEVGALAGDPWWGSEDGLTDASTVLTRIDQVNATTTEPIRSVHLDVEPWGLDEWATMKSSLTIDYVEFVEDIAEEAASLESPLELSFLVPFWFDGTSDEAPQIEVDDVVDYPFQQLQRTSGVSWIVMAYRDRMTGEGGVIELVADERRLSGVVGLAVETAPVEPLSISFADESVAALDDALRELDAADLGLVEIVVNDLEHLRVLASGPSDTIPPR